MAALTPRSRSGLGTMLRSRRVGLASTVVLALLAGLLVWFATKSEGETVRRAELNDGGVWVSHGTLSRFGRINKPAGQLDAAVAAPTPPQTGLDILQDGAAVLGFAKATNQVFPVNVRTATLAESAALTLPAPLPTGSGGSGDSGGSGGLPASRSIDMRGGTVAVIEPATGKLRVQRVDPAVGITVLDQLVASVEPVATIGGGAVVAVGIDGTVYAASAASGQLAVVRPLPAAGTAGLSAGSPAPAGAAGAAGSAGSPASSGSAGGFAEPQIGDLGFTSSSPTGLQLSVVGTRWVVLDLPSGMLRADGLGAPVDVRARLQDPAAAGQPQGAGQAPGGPGSQGQPPAQDGGGSGAAYAIVQQPGPEADSVVLAGARGTVAVALVGDTPTTGAVLLPPDVTGATGRPGLTAPVRLGSGSGSCVHAAWTVGEVAHYGRVCGGGIGQTVAITGRGSAPTPAGQPALPVPARTDGIALRVNRGLIVLNDLDTGDLWDLDSDRPSKIDDWASVIPPPKQGDKNAKATPETADDQAVRRPPEANPDTLSVRPGRTSTLHVLDNDTDTQGAVLAIAPGDVGAPDVPGIQVTSSVDGQTLSVSVPDHPAARTVHFTYGVNNGTTGPDGRAVGQVTLSIVEDSVNTAPHVRPGQARIAATRTPVNRGGYAAVAVLADWRDDENDPLVVEALDPGTSVDAAGALGISAGPTAGTQERRYRVDDGRGGSTESKVSVQVLGPADRAVAPVAQADVVRAVVGKPVQLQPLGNDLPGADPIEPGARMRLAAEVRGPAQLHLDTNLETGVVTVTGATAGSYLLTYAAQVGSAVGAGRLRVDVLAPPTEDAPPVAAPDAATLREQAPTITDVLVNDYSPRSDVLVITSVATRESWVRAWVVAGRWLRVQATSPLPVSSTERRGVLAYTISDGTRTATGELSVVQKPPPPAAVLPTVVDDQGTVRWGDVVALPVLDNDSMADGVPLKIAPASVKVLTGGGRVFVSNSGGAAGGVLRYVPETVPGAPITADQAVLLEYAAYPEGMPERAVTARVQVTVKPPPGPSTPNMPPSARSFSASVTAGDALTITVPTSGVDPDGDLVFVQGVVGEGGGPVNLRLGRVTGFGASSIRYEAYPLAAGTEVIRYVVADRYGKTGEGLIRVGVVAPGVPQPPVAVADDVLAAPGRVLHIDVLANDLLPRGTDVAIEDPAVVNSGPVLGQFTREADQTFTVTAPEEANPKTIVYGITSGLFDPSRTTLSVRGRVGHNNAPVALDDTARVTAATLAAGGATPAPSIGPGQPGPAAPSVTSVLVDVLANDRDLDGERSALTVVEVGEGATITPEGVRVTFADHPRAIPYVVADADGATAMAVVYVPANGSDVPYAVSGKTISMPTDGSVSVRLADYVTDPRGRSVKVTTPDTVSTSPAQQLQAVVVGPGELTLTASGGYVGPGALMLEVTDSTGPEDQAPRTAYVVIAVQVGPLVPLLRCPTWEVVVVADGADRVVDIPRLCAAWFPEGLDPTSVGYAAAWTTPVDQVRFTVGGEGDRLVTLAAGPDALHAARGEFAVGLRGSEQRYPVRVRVVSFKQGAPGTAPGATPADLPPPPPPAVVRPARVEGLKAGESAVVNLAQYLDSPFGTLHCTVAGVRVTSGQGVSGRSTGCVLTVTATPDATGVAVLSVDVSDGPDRIATGTVTVSVLARPTPPQGVAAAADRVQGGAVTVSWRPPAYDGGLPVLEYRVSGGGRAENCGLTLSCTITGLTNGQTYTFTVAARNGVGWSPESEVSGPAVPDTTPGQPAVGSITPGDTTLTVTWSAPENRGSAITGYRITVTNVYGGPGSTDLAAGADARAITVSGLDNSSRYQIRVTARNELDWGPPSAPAVGQPVGYPHPVTGIVVTPAAPTPQDDSGVVRISWQAAFANGPEPVSYQVYRSVSGGGWDPVPTPSGQLWANDTVAYHGQVIGYSVLATNAGGKESRRDLVVTYTAIGVPETPAPPSVTTPAPDKKMTVHATLGNPRASAWSRLEYRTTASVSGSVPCTSASGCTLDFVAANGSTEPQTLTVRGCVAGGSCSDWSGPSPTFQPYGPTLPVLAQDPQLTGSRGDYTVTFRWTLQENGRPVTVDIVAVSGGSCRRLSDTACEMSGLGYSTTAEIQVRTSSAAGNTESVTMRRTTPADLPPELSIAPGALCSGTQCGGANASWCPAGTNCRWVVVTSKEWEATQMNCDFTAGATDLGSQSMATNGTITSTVAYGQAVPLTVTCRSPRTGESVTATRTWVDPPE